MIGKIMLGRSFGGCIAYCLEDKKQRREQEAVIKNRAEVLLANYCSGSKQALVEQFREVRRLNPRVEKPVMHIILSGAPGDKLDRGRLIQLVQDLARDMGFERHQYLAVAHSDTGHPHVHVVVNRVGLDGKTLKDSHNYRKMAAFCRQMEKKYGLKTVLSPRRFLTGEQRLMPRQDGRKETLRMDIIQSLSNCKTLEDFQLAMKALGYGVVKGRGICFIDPKGVRIKGSEVGYALGVIERKLSQSRGLNLPQHTPAQHPMRTPAPPLLPKGLDRERALKALQVPEKEMHFEKVLGTLFQNKEDMPAGVNPELLKEAKKKKSKRRSLHL